MPLVQWIGRLHVVMSVNKKMRTALAARRGGSDQGMAGGGVPPGLQAHLPAMRHQPIGTVTHVRPMIRLRGDARKSQICAELLDKSSLISGEIFEYRLHVATM